jgi:hypothetical protein
MRDHIRMNDPVHGSTIPLAEIKRLHEIGFILIPLLDDGKTPNTSSLLTEDERLKSIRESNDGREHPIRYICNHPDFWNGERIEKEKDRFKNVATALDRTHIRGPDGRSLYLNALDIDSEQVFTILCRLSGPNGQDIYFINEMCKITFVSKTKKKYGRYIFWLSHEQRKPIGTRNCKRGNEFEIKTNNSLGLITLPPSRHRDGPNTLYHSIGQNKIKIIDKMYDQLLIILADCLRPANSKSSGQNRSHQKEKNVEGEGCNQDSGYVEFTFQSIANYLLPLYKQGHRNSIILGFAGLSYKRDLPKEYAARIIELLTVNDEERTNRFRILDDTYNKESKLVSGYTYFLSVLENASGEHRIAVDILRKILTSIDGITHSNEDPPVPVGEPV